MIERSPWTVASLAVTFTLLGAGLLLPWFSFHHSTGQSAPPDAPPSAVDASVERRTILFYPFEVRGDATPQERSDAERPTLILGVLACVALGLTFAALVVELVRGHDEGTRIVQMSLLLLAFLASAAALVWTWIAFPPILSAEGVDGAFTTRNDQSTFIRSTLSWGWVTTGFALATLAAAFAFKYAGGTFTLAFLEKFDRARQ